MKLNHQGNGPTANPDNDLDGLRAKKEELQTAIEKLEHELAVFTAETVTEHTSTQQLLAQAARDQLQSHREELVALEEREAIAILTSWFERAIFRIQKRVPRRFASRAWSARDFAGRAPLITALCILAVCGLQDASFRLTIRGFWGTPWANVAQYAAKAGLLQAAALLWTTLAFLAVVTAGCIWMSGLGPKLASRRRGTGWPTTVRRIDSVVRTTTLLRFGLTRPGKPTMTPIWRHRAGVLLGIGLVVFALWIATDLGSPPALETNGEDPATSSESRASGIGLPTGFWHFSDRLGVLSALASHLGLTDPPREALPPGARAYRAQFGHGMDEDLPEHTAEVEQWLRTWRASYDRGEPWATALAQP